MSQDMTEGGVSTSSWDAPLTMLGSVVDLVSQIAAFLGPEMLGHHILELKLQVYLSHLIVAFVHNFLHQAMRTSGIISAKGGGMRKSGEKPYLPPACLRVQAWGSEMHTIINLCLHQPPWGSKKGVWLDA
jgi:hypothetical protein